MGGMPQAIGSILHPTDFSDLSGAALAHALRVALATRSQLHLLHIAERDAGETPAFPQVRRLLVQWGLAGADDPPWVVSDKLGLVVDSITVRWQDPAQGILSYLDQKPCDLVVFATHGRDGIERWLRGSVSEMVLRRLAIPALFMTQGARGFVSQINGDIQLRRVLIPVDFSPAPREAVEVVQNFVGLIGDETPTVHLLHVGHTIPPLPAELSQGTALPPVILRSGNVVEAIVNAAIEFDIDLIGMPTAGHHGVLDALRGSTTERVIRHAPCPVLAVPVI
jgi:nucleotide-binding universal stress UspA family protein